MGDLSFARTLAILQQLAKGKRVAIADRYLAMGGHYEVGYIMTNFTTGEEYVVGDLTFAQLNTLLDEHDIGFPIPEWH